MVSINTFQAEDPGPIQFFGQGATILNNRELLWAKKQLMMNDVEGFKIQSLDPLFILNNTQSFINHKII